MKVVLKDTGVFVFRVDDGEDVLNEIKNFCEKNQIKAGWFSGLGAASDVTLEFYNRRTKHYEEKSIAGQVEVLSLTGNVSSMNGHIMVHAHGAVADQNYWMSGGHIKKLVASPVCEIFFTRLTGVLKRTPDLDTHLNLLK